MTYYFNRKGEADLGDQFEYFQPSREFITEWQEAWTEKTGFAILKRDLTF